MTKPKPKRKFVSTKGRYPKMQITKYPPRSTRAIAHYILGQVGGRGRDRYSLISKIITKLTSLLAEQMFRDLVEYHDEFQIKEKEVFELRPWAVMELTGTLRNKIMTKIKRKGLPIKDISIDIQTNFIMEDSSDFGEKLAEFERAQLEAAQEALQRQKVEEEINAEQSGDFGRDSNTDVEGV